MIGATSRRCTYSSTPTIYAGAIYAGMSRATSVNLPELIS